VSWSLRRRLAVSLLAVGLVLVSVVAATGLLVAQVRDSQNRVSVDYFEAVNASNDAFLSLLDGETAVRGYALTADQALLQPFLSSTSPEQEARIRRLEAFAADRPALRDAVRQAEATARDWYVQFATPLVQQVRAGGPAAVDLADIARGKVLFDRVRIDYGALRQRLLDARTHERHRLADRTNALFGVVLLVAVLVALAAAVLFVALRRWVTAPLDRLGDDVRRVRDGHLDHPVRPAGPPEIRTVARDVDAMRLVLVHRLEQVRVAGAEIETSRQLLVEQAEELSRSNRDLEQFAYVASHDLQEPLRKVASFCQLLERRYSGQLDERADQYIAFAVDGAKRMQQLINDLLAFSRVGRTGAEDFESVPLQLPFDRALLNLAAAVEHSEAEISADPLPAVRGESGLLTQLFQNLIGNAVKFHGEQRPVVRVTVLDRGDQWELAVVDNGIGVEPQYADRVFVIFQRLHPKAAYEGTGIGLALCKRIVEHHGGRIWLESPERGGTAVRFTLPKDTTEDAA
ncbi:MAG: hypothetical protein JWL64_1756, partial [Frankiales bacterium]|nr:hypothetical protein [Frankiales bacterium]